MRYPRSGTATSAIGGATCTTTAYPPSLLSGGIGSGRVFWLRGLSIAYMNATDTSTGNIEFFDAASGATATSALALKIDGLGVSVATGAAYPGDLFPGRAVYKFDAPGIKFSTGITAMVNASGAIPAGHLTVWGYEE